MKNKNQTGLKNFKPKIILNHNIYFILLIFFVVVIFKVKQRGLLQKYDEEIDGEEKKSFVLGKNIIAFN